MTTETQDNSSGFTTDGSLDLASRPQAPSTVSTETVLDQTTPAQQGKVAQAVAEAPLEHAKEVAATPLSDKIGSVITNWDTTHTIHAFSEDMHRLDDIDPNFHINDHLGQVMNVYQLEPTEGNVKELSKATSQQDMVNTAQTLREHQDAQHVLADHGVYSFVGGLLDPVWLGVNVGTLGVGSALKVGRLGTAALEAAGAAGVTAASNRMGENATPADFLLNSALAGGLGLLFGPQHASKLLSEKGGTLVPGSAEMASEVGIGADVKGAGLNPTGPTAGFAFDSKLAPINKFTTEFDALSPNPEAVNYSAKIMDDPIGRTGAIQENSAASLNRVWRNRAEGMLKDYHDHLDDVLKEQGHGFFSRTLDWDGSARAARDSFQNDVYADLIRRDQEHRLNGVVSDNPDPRIAKAVQHVENLNNSMGQLAKEAGVMGFEDFTPRPGYVHRAWNPDAAVGAMAKHGTGTVRDLFKTAVRQSFRTSTEEDARAIADAFITRLKAMHQNETVDFRGGLGKADTGSIREMLENTPGVDLARLQSIMGRLESKEKSSTIKFAKRRTDLDMTASVTTPSGERLSMQDLVHKDIDRISENYAHQMVGRSALAAAGVGGSDSEIRKFSQEWANHIAGKGATKDQIRAAQQKVAGVVGDFTGMRPEGFQLSPGLSNLSALTSMTVLSASGLWQLGEYGTMAFKFGLKNTVESFLKYAPGLRNVLSKIRRDPALLQEFNDVANFQLTRDVQLKPWLRQIELNETAKDTRWQRALHYGKQAIPYVNGMKYIQGHQAQMVAEMAVQTLVKAANGEKSALKRLLGHNVSEDTLGRIKANVDKFANKQGNRVTRLALGAWPPEDVERMTQAAARLMDSGLLMARTGEGASWFRTPTGQVLGMFRSFVAFSHNKQLRAVFNNHGVLGLAHIMAYQYPLMYMTMFLNDARKHPKGDGDDAAQLALKTFGMLGAMGFLGDAAGILGLTGGQGGLSTPVFGALNNIKGISQAAQSFSEGDYTGGAWKAGKALTMSTPVLAAFPATSTLVESLKPDDLDKKQK